MKKTMIVLALLGLVSVGTMAFVEKGNDEPPSRDRELRYERHGCYGHYDGDHRHGRRGGCCGRERYRDRREDMIVATTGRNAGRAIMTVARRPTATVTASCARLVPSGITAIRAMTFTVAVDGVPMKVARL